MKLSHLIVLAVLPIALIGCGKSDAEKAKDGADAGNQALAQAQSLDIEVARMSRQALADGEISEDEMRALKPKAEACLANYKRALQIASSVKGVTMENREAVEKRVRQLEQSIEQINQALSQAEKERAEKNRSKDGEVEI